MKQQSGSKVTKRDRAAKRLGGPLSIRTIITRCFPCPGEMLSPRYPLNVGLLACLGYCLFVGLRSQRSDGDPAT